MRREARVTSASPTGPRLVTLKRRKEYLRVRNGARCVTPSLTVEAVRRATAAVEPAQSSEGRPDARFGFTVTRKIGNAVVRNRVRRRLKEAVRLALRGRGAMEADYVVVARSGALSRTFAELQADLDKALVRVASGLRRESEGTDRPRSAKRSPRGPDAPAGSAPPDPT